MRENRGLLFFVHLCPGPGLSIGRFIRLSKTFPSFQIFASGSAKMVTYSIKDLMGLCSDYALDAQIQKILFSMDLWVPKAARVRSILSISTMI